MNPKLPAVVILFTMIACNTNTQTGRKSYAWPTGMTPPVAEKKLHQRILHGDTVNDDYFWMIDFFKKGPDSSRVVDHLKAENAYLDTMMAGTRGFQEKLFAEMKARIKEKDESLPFKNNGYWYYSRF